jgi:hypothetical protein
MGIRGDFKDLVKIVNEGGLEVVTEIGTTGSEGNTSATRGGEKKETQEERKTCKSYDSRGIRTTIQLDGDYVTMMSPEALNMPELWKRHTETLKEKLFVVERVRRLASVSSLLIFVLSFLWALYAAATGGFLTYGSQWFSVVGLLLGAVFIKLRNEFIWWLTRNCVRIMWWLADRYARIRWRLAKWQRQLRSCLFPTPAK